MDIVSKSRNNARIGAALALTALVATAGCSKRVYNVTPDPMEGHVCPTGEQFDLRDAALDELTYAGTVRYTTQKGDTVSELAIEMTEMGRGEFGKYFNPITQEEVMKEAGITDPLKLPVGIELIIDVYNPTTRLHEMAADAVGELGDVERFNDVISH